MKVQSPINVIKGKHIHEVFYLYHLPSAEHLHKDLLYLEGNIFSAVHSLFDLPTFLLFMMCIMSNQIVFGFFCLVLFDRESLLI